MNRQSHEMSFARQTQAHENQDLHQVLAKTYKQTQKLMHDVKHFNYRGTISKFNYYGKKYRFQQQVSPRMSMLEPLQTISHNQKQIKEEQRTIVQQRRYQSLEPLQSRIEKNKTKQFPLNYEIVFKKQKPNNNDKMQISDQKDHYLHKKIQNLQKEIVELKTENSKLRRASLRSIESEPRKKEVKQKRINFQKFIKDLS